MSAQVVIDVSGGGGLADAAAGDVAVSVGDAFVAATDAVRRSSAGDGVLVRCTADGPALVGALTSLCRSLAREAAPRGIRVNAILGPPAADVAGLIAFLGSPAGVMCTGAVLRAVAS
jgi:hypothetical protein